MEEGEELVLGPQQPEPGLKVTKALLQESIQGDLYPVLVDHVEVLISKIDIPLIQLVEMTEVRSPLDIDIQK